MLTVHVDDILHGGNDTFYQKVIQPLSLVLKFGTTNTNAFLYLGIQLHQNKDFSITVNQNNFAQSIKKIPIADNANRHTLLSSIETEMLRSAVGQLTWLAGISRPDISFNVCIAATRAGTATIGDALDVNKIISKVQAHLHLSCFISLILILCI